MDDPQTTPRSPLWMRVLLCGSLAINLLIVGLVVGLWVRGPQSHDFVRGGPGLGIREVPRALPESQLRPFRREMFGERRALRAVRNDVLALRKDVAAAVSATPYDPTALEGVLDRYQSITGRAERIAWDVVLNRLEKMSAEERAAFAQNLLRPPKRRQKQNRPRREE